jgi:hypothetical protein
MPAATSSPCLMPSLISRRPGSLQQRKNLFLLNPAPGVSPTELSPQRTGMSIVKRVMTKPWRVQHRKGQDARQPSGNSPLEIPATFCDRLPHGEALATIRAPRPDERVAPRSGPMGRVAFSHPASSGGLNPSPGAHPPMVRRGLPRAPPCGRHSVGNVPKTRRPWVKDPQG